MKLPLLFAATLLTTLANTGCATEPDATSLPATHETTAPAAVVAPSTVHGSPTHAVAAVESLKTLASLVTPRNALGFASVSEVASASLAEPLPMFMVRLDELQAYRAGDDPLPLLRDEGSVFYPVMVGGDVRSSVLVRNVNGEWKATQFGRSELAKLSHDGRAHVAASRGIATAGVSLVEIPAISQRMLEHEESGVPMLTALLDVPGTDLRAGSTMRAADVLAKLQWVAARTDRMTPN